MEQVKRPYENVHKLVHNFLNRKNTSLDLHNKAQTVLVLSNSRM